MPWPFPPNAPSSASLYSQHISSPSGLPDSDTHTSSPDLHSCAPLSTNSSAHLVPEKPKSYERPATYTIPRPLLAAPSPYHYHAHIAHKLPAPSTRSAH